MARYFSYPQLRAFVATNPPGSSNEQAALDAIHLLIRDPDLYRGSQVDEIAATMSPLEIVGDRQAIPPGPLADTLTEALARHDPEHGHHEHTIPDPPPTAPAQASVTALRPAGREPAAAAPARGERFPDPAPPDVEPEYFDSLLAETEARLAGGETDLIAEIDHADEHDPQRHRDVADYSCFAALDHDLDLNDRGAADRDRRNELDYGCFAGSPDLDESEARARTSLGQARDELTAWDRRRDAHEHPARDTQPPASPTSRLDHAALEADRARRDVAEQETRRHAAAERHLDLGADYNLEPPAP